jgi:signal transduction histidine kinase
MTLDTADIQKKNDALEASSTRLKASLARLEAEHQRAQSALREDTRLLSLLNDTWRKVASQLDLDTVLQTVTDAATELTGARFGAFFYNRINEKGEDYLLYTLSGAPREAFERFGHPRATALFGPTFRGEPPIRSDDVTRDPRYGTMGPHHGMPPGHLPVRSYLAAPVKSQTGEVFGGLFFGHPEPGMFTERTEQLIVGLAAQASVAIENARRYQAAQSQLAHRERTEASLRDSDRRKDEFLATLAHELRNPLAPIRQAALVLQSAEANPEQKTWCHQVISRQVKHMSLLLDDLLDISRITRGTLALRPKPTDLASMVATAVETVRPLIDSKRQQLSVESPQVPVQLDVDPLRISQVLSNLLTNAAKYTDPEGRVRIASEIIGGEAVIRVSDTGIGISAETLPKVFEMFSQVKSARDGSDGGLGIGLALSRGLVELHGGRIVARSAGLGHGSEFSVYLPLATRAALEPEPMSPTAHSKNANRTVLIADDNVDAAESLAMLLRLDGHHVEVAGNGTEAVELFDKLHPDVAILDIGMPGMNGYEAARRIRARPEGKGIALIAVTGWGQEADKARAAAAGFDHHFTKPVEPEALISLIGK